MIEGPGARAASLDADPGTGSPWFRVVARGHGRLMAEFRTLFRDDARVRVIEDRRDRSALLPRSDVGPRPPVAGA
jgi:hypothetical protein